MPAFPYTKQGITTKQSQLLGIDISRAVNGSARGKSFYSVTKSNFDVSIPLLTQAELDALQQFIADNRATPVDLHYEGDGKTYFCIINGLDISPLGACRFQARVSMVEI
jgi:hypothetical protein